MKQITEIQYRRLLNRLEIIETEIPIVTDEIQRAANHGDMRENSELDAANGKMQLLEADKSSILDILRHSEVVKHTDSNRIVIGSLLSVKEIKNGVKGKERLLLFDNYGDTVIAGVLNAESDLGRKVNGNPSGVYNIQAEGGETLTYEVTKEPISRLAEYDKEHPDEKEFFERHFSS